MKQVPHIKRLASLWITVGLLASAMVPASSAEEARATAAAAATKRPAITIAQRNRLADLHDKGDFAALRTLVHQLEQERDPDSMPLFGVFQAAVLIHDKKPLQGSPILREALSKLKQQWEQAATPDHGQAYALALHVQANLYDAQAQKEQRDASRDQSYAVALQALGPSHRSTQWLLYLRMYDAITMGNYPLALQLANELEPQLPQPLNRCVEDLCRSFRFQRANLAGSMGEPELALRMSKELMPGLKNDPHHAAWNVYHLMYLTKHLKLSKEYQHWCAQAKAMSKRPEFRDKEGVNRAVAQCMTGPKTDDKQFQRLIAQEIKLRGAGSDGHAYLFLQQAENFGRQERYAEAGLAAAQAWAIGIARQIDHWQWVAPKIIGETMADRERYPEAIYYTKQAINAQQRLLRNTKNLPANQYESILRAGGAMYEDLAEWLLQYQRFAEAEKALTLAREQSYHRLVRSYQSTQSALEFTPAEQARDAAIQPLQTSLQAAWLDRENNSKQLPKTLAQAAKILDQRLPESSTNQAPATRLSTLAANQTEVRYLPAHEHIYVVIRRGHQPEQHLRLPLAQKQLTQDIALLRRELQQPGSNPQAQAQKLYRQLWQPLMQWLPQPMPEAAAGQAPEVRVHLEGALRYLPMAALHDGQHWLGESYALPQDTGVTASAEVNPVPKTALTRKGWSLQSSSRAAADLPPLPKVREEINGLAQLATASGIEHDASQDDAFTADSLRAALQSRKVVHLASHFRLLPGNGQASGLYLGNGQLLTLGELNDPSFRFDGLDLLTLSACETALPSGPSEQGLAVDSLAWLAQARGARNVLASLWAVADEGTQELMHAFYSALAQGMPHAQALRAAQLALLSSEGKASQAQTRGLVTSTTHGSGDTLAHPYYWSGFVLLAAAQ